ncbi:hypothetical protein N5I32_00215 [Acidimangrovimonas sediminis]|uniref:Uncharacterized protein n=1 Tax=Albidovulum sediminis TaxID=3066345 RepID=A0ABT2NGM8_9RHOB|nr:hypothetical protein [Defluviimonas sediminis]
MLVTAEASELIRLIDAKGQTWLVLDPAENQIWLAGSPKEAVVLLGILPSDRMRIVLHGVGTKQDQGDIPLAGWGTGLPRPLLVISALDRIGATGREAQGGGRAG